MRRSGLKAALLSLRRCQPHANRSHPSPQIRRLHVRGADGEFASDPLTLLHQRTEVKAFARPGRQSVCKAGYAIGCDADIGEYSPILQIQRSLDRVKLPGDSRDRSIELPGRREARPQ